MTGKNDNLEFGQFIITKNVLTISLVEQRTIDWFSQYLIIPLTKPLIVETGEEIEVEFSYAAGASFSALTSSLKVSPARQSMSNICYATQQTKQLKHAIPTP